MKRRDFLKAGGAVFATAVLPVGFAKEKKQNTLPSDPIMDKMPVGTIVCSNEPLNGYLPCSGSATSIDIYKDLFNVIGHKYGDPKNMPIFYLPNLNTDYIKTVKPYGQNWKYYIKY